MRNMEQIRAQNALEFSRLEAIKGPDGGEVIKKVPPMIINHGLLATAAYSFSEKKEAWGKVFDAMAKHLAHPDIGLLPATAASRQALMDHLTAPSATSETLKAATAEALAWLCYARRFVQKKEASQ